jgi:predicted transcriptional regulator
MGLKDKLANLPEVSHPLYCTLGKILDELPKEDKDALTSALVSHASTRSITEVLRTEGYKVDRQTVTLHRKGFCRCKEAK